jgi:hypothetical protein
MAVVPLNFSVITLLNQFWFELGRYSKVIVLSSLGVTIATKVAELVVTFSAERIETTDFKRGSSGCLHAKMKITMVSKTNALWVYGDFMVRWIILAVSELIITCKCRKKK